ncbi:MAG: hypothetical protein ABEH40_06065 [Haloferacaceae archaeon]
MRGTDRFASVVDPGEKTKLSPAVVVSTALLILGFVVGIGYRLLIAAG